MASGHGTWSDVYEIVRQIPAGKVMNYGAVAKLLTRPLPARAVGWAMADCPEDVPWQRVVNVRGECSADRSAGAEIGRQRRRLEAEGVVFVGGRVDMAAHAWSPEDYIE